MVESQQLIEATKHSTDGNTAMANENYDAAVISFKQAANWYEKAAELTTEPKARDALLLLKETYERSSELAQRRKLLVPYKEAIKKVKGEKGKDQDPLNKPKTDHKDEEVKENKKLLDELKTMRGTLLQDMNKLIKTNEKHLTDFEKDIKTKEKHIKVTVEDLGKENENNPFNSSIIEESMDARYVAIKVSQLKEVSHEFTKLYNKAMESFNKLEMIATTQAKEVEGKLKGEEEYLDQPPRLSEKIRRNTKDAHN